MDPDVPNAHAQDNNVANQRNKYAALEQVPEKARKRQNPFEGDTDAVAAGGKLFEQHCAECHGRKGGGTRHGVSLLRSEVQLATPGTLFWVLTNGVVRHGMPVWSKLPEPERWQLVTFLQSFNLRPPGSQLPNSQSGVPSPERGTQDAPIP
jgi:cytochrome c oxidase cbb3-type subunit 2